MFRRRLQIFLGVLLAVAVLLLARSVQLQVVQHKYWEDQALARLKQTSYLETNRGPLVDFRGRVMASDVGCIDAAVDYRAIVKDPDWIRDQAKARLKAHPELKHEGQTDAAALAEQKRTVSSDIDAMWDLLARISGESADQIEQTKSDIIRRVELRRRSIWYSHYEKGLAARAKNQHGPVPWYRAWLLGDDSDSGPQLDSQNFRTGDEVASHVILHAIDDATYNRLTKILSHCPGLELKPSAHRVYAEPANTCCAQMLGHLSTVSREDLLADPNVGDDLRRYFPNDLIGRTGLEAFAEPLLRGARGKQETDPTGRRAPDTTPPVVGRAVRCTIDLDLQWQIMQLFKELRINSHDIRQDLHGAAVVIDVPTGQVRAMVSYPTYDLNHFDADYAELAANTIDRPLLDRATMMALEPGSSVKPLIGSWAVTHGIIGVNEGIECTGYLVIDGKRLPYGRCWTMSMYGMGHHLTPSSFPHRGHDGNSNGFLTVTDALERSCNVFFETTAHRMGLRNVAQAMHDFGLGQRTGLGIEESPGRIPAFSTRWKMLWTTCWAGIGQGDVAATPIQMANVAATIARGGLWIRPSLLADPDDVAAARAWQRAREAEEKSPAQSSVDRATLVSEKIAPATAPDDVAADAEDRAIITNDAEGMHIKFHPRTADRVNLDLSASALAAVKLGMIRVVNSPAGTGTAPQRTDMLVAGKTGSAQAAKLSRWVMDDKGHKVLQVFEPGAFPWYQGVMPARPDPNKPAKPSLVHAWYIGFAPADHPRIAFAVAVEYGGSGGGAAGAIARELIERCIEDGYLKVPPHPPSDTWENDADWQSLSAGEE